LYYIFIFQKLWVLNIHASNVNGPKVNKSNKKFDEFSPKMLELKFINCFSHLIFLAKFLFLKKLEEKIAKFGLTFDDTSLNGQN